MLWVIHLLVGMIFGVAIDSWIIIIPVALLSHFLLDMLPHWDGIYDKKKFRKTGVFKFHRTTLIVRSLDMIISLYLVYYFFAKTHSVNLLIGAFFAGLPDMVKVFYFTPLKNTKTYKYYLRFHSIIQRDTTFLIGMSTQIILGIILFLALNWFI